MNKIAVVGAGYVGLVTAAALAKLGHDVTCVDVDVQKVKAVKANRLPIEEPDLKPLWQRYQRRSTLRMTADYAEAVRDADFVFLCVGTPPGRNGSVNLLHLISAPAARPPVLSNPECLREGHALEDFLRPTRVIIGSADESAGRRVAELYAPLDAPMVFCNSRPPRLSKNAPK